MAFENSPTLEKPSQQKPSSVPDWLAIHRRKIYIALIAFLIVWSLIVLAIFLTRTVSTADQHGGLDGTILSRDLSPLSAEIIINNEIIKNYEDGYFFVPDLPPGEYPVKINSSQGTLQRTVVIVTGQVNELGRLIIE